MLRPRQNQPGAAKGRFVIKVDRHGLYWETLPDGKRRCEVTVVIASVGAGDQIYSHKVSELESVVESKRFEQQWNRPAVFDLVTDLPSKTGHVRIVVRDAHSDRIGQRLSFARSATRALIGIPGSRVRRSGSCD